MIKIKNFKEEWIDAIKFTPSYSGLGYYEIFKNPDTKELNDACKNNTRGIILPNGNFYVIKDSCMLLHIGMLQILNEIKILKNKWGHEWYSEEDSLNEFMGIERIGNSFKFSSAFSYPSYFLIKSGIFNQYKINFEKENSKYVLLKDRTYD